MIAMLEWYHGVLSNYSRGFDEHTLEHLDASTRVNDIENNAREGDMNKNNNDSLALALDGIWRSLGGGTALFCVVLHFFGMGAVLPGGDPHASKSMFMFMSMSMSNPRFKD